MKKLIEKIFGIKVVKDCQWRELETRVDEMVQFYDSISGDEYHHNGRAAEVKLEQIGRIHLVKNILIEASL